MDSTYSIGLLLVGLSAAMLAMHWQQWRQPPPPYDPDLQQHRWQNYVTRLVRRRAVAGSLVGLVGFTLMAFKTVPRTPLSITAYLFGLVFMTCWILWLACMDMLASRRLRDDLQLDQIAAELRRVESKAHPNDLQEP